MLNKLIYFIFFINSIYPCAVCYGAPDDPVTLGINKAIIFLLCMIVFVLSCIIYWIMTLIKRSNEIKI